MLLRDYQTEEVEAQLTALSEGVRSTLSGLFTGAGKTVVFCELARRVAETMAGRTLIMPPLRELVWQAVEKVREVAEIDPGVEMGEFRSQEEEWWSPQVVVASKQTLMRGRYRKFKDIRLVVVDEAHLSYSPACLEMLRWFQDQGAMVAGYTATPFRMSGERMLDFYERMIGNRDIQWAIDNGWSVPPLCKLARVDSMDLSGVQVTGGDFNQGALGREMEKEANLHRIALITSEEMDGPTVVFTPSVNSAKGVAHYLNNNYEIPAVYVYGSQPEEERRDALAAFKSGRARVLCNCQVVAVGFDFPPTRTLVLGRPTRSRSFWLQCVGRATRPLPGTVDFAGGDPDSRRAAIAASEKRHFKIVDCTDATLDHRLITSVDMFCTADKEVRDAVKRGAADKPLTQEEMDALAQQELERRLAAQEIERRRLATVGRATGLVSSRQIDLAFGGKRCIGTYMNPLRGKYAGLRMNQLPDHYLEWACNNPGIKGWIKNNFLKERRRRNGLAAAS